MTDGAGHGGCVSDVDHDRNLPEVDLLAPLTMRGVTLRNRIVVSPMCQYCAVDGVPDDWHLVHLGSRAVGGAGLIFTEATAVAPEGRISPGDTGIWNDEQAQAFSRIAAFIHRMGGVAGMQIAHAGRKASCQSPWLGGARLKTEAEGGWQTIAPSAIPFHDDDPLPHALTIPEIEAVQAAFVAAAQRALGAGFRVLELHAAHGYLMHEFLSPLSNQRTDKYGGSLENRLRLVLETAAAVRAIMPSETVLMVRISATDWVEGGWDLEQSIVLAQALRKLGVDLIDCSSGAIVPKATIPVAKNFQVPFAEAIRQRAEIMTGAVGLITDAQQANEIITSGAADLVFVGREMLREPYWALKTEAALNEEPTWPTPYGYAVHRRKR
ncbi:MAG TPA: NADH:flavin oxidoreductase/NADH oxidase [Pirellulaceae bacterium]|nr:NADH:flavin oxidoreductase/NADH oxidase [Pirellulaceae bacterium]